MEPALIIALINVLLALVTIFLGILIAGRLAGKLRISAILLILLLGILVVKEVLVFVDISYHEVVKELMCTAAILLVFFAAINMKQMIDGIDNHLGRREKKAKGR